MCHGYPARKSKVSYLYCTLCILLWWGLSRIFYSIRHLNKPSCSTRNCHTSRHGAVSWGLSHQWKILDDPFKRRADSFPHGFILLWPPQKVLGKSKEKSEEPNYYKGVKTQSKQRKEKHSLLKYKIYSKYEPLHRPKNILFRPVISAPGKQSAQSLVEWLVQCRSGSEGCRVRWKIQPGIHSKNLRWYPRISAMDFHFVAGVFIAD